MIPIRPHPRPAKGMQWLSHALACLAAGLLISSGPARSETMVFQGQIESSARAELSSQVNGVVAEVLFTGGEKIAAGQPMIRLDPVDAELAVAVAEANLAAAEAARDGAAQEAARQERLAARGISPDAVLTPARTAKAAAEAALALANAELARAKLDLSRTVIRAPIAGFAGRPITARGAFVEAESGAPLGHITTLDPVMVAYRVPYDQRLNLLSRTRVRDLVQLFQRIELTVSDASGEHEYTARPSHAANEIDQSDGSVTVWAELPNPRLLLRPGMAVTVTSRLMPAEIQ
ncbi:MAG: efflux RND transporter periplasmic adaptor subunit [Pseudomonadota bacterium]